MIEGDELDMGGKVVERLDLAKFRIRATSRIVNLPFAALVGMNSVISLNILFHLCLS